MNFLKRNIFFINILASLSFWIVITPNKEEFSVMPWYFIGIIYESTSKPLFTSFLHFLTVMYTSLLIPSGLALLFSGFKNKYRTLISIWSAVVLFSLLFTPIYLPAWLNLTALSSNATFIVLCTLSLTINILVNKDEQEEWRELKTRLVR
jgi:hypothetical protein